MRVSHIKHFKLLWIDQSTIRTYILKERKTIAYCVPNDLTCKCRPGCWEANQRTLPYGGPYAASIQYTEKGRSHSLSKFKVTSVGGEDPAIEREGEGRRRKKRKEKEKGEGRKGWGKTDLNEFLHLISELRFEWTQWYARAAWYQPRADCGHLFPTLCSVISYRLLQTDHSRSITLQK